MLPHSLTNFDNLPKIKDESYVINLDEFKSVGTHSIAYMWMMIT